MKTSFNYMNNLQAHMHRFNLCSFMHACTSGCFPVMSEMHTSQFINTSLQVFNTFLKISCLYIINIEEERQIMKDDREVAWCSGQIFFRTANLLFHQLNTDCETGALAIVQPGLTAGWFASRLASR